MGWFSDLADETRRENQGLKVHQTRIFLEALSVVLLSIRGMAECFEYFPMTIMQPVQRWGLHLTEQWAPYLKWVPGPEGITAEILARWFFGLVYQVPVVLAFILLTYVLITIFRRERPSFLMVIMTVGIALIPYKTWWYSASGEAVWVITPQLIHLGFPGETYLVPPVQTIEAYWRTYIATGIVFFMWSIGLMYGLHRYLFKLTRLQGYLLNVPWVVYCTYVMGGIWPEKHTYSFWQISGYMFVLVLIAWGLLVGGKRVLESRGKERFVQRWGGQIACWTCILLAVFYYEFTFRQRDKTPIESDLMVLGGHYEAVGKTIDWMEALQQEGKIVITRNVKLVDKTFQQKLGETTEKTWTYADIVRSMIQEEYAKKHSLHLSATEAQTLLRWDEKGWLALVSMDPEIGRLIRFIAQGSGEGGAA